MIRGRIKAEVIIHADNWGGYDGLVDVGHERHFDIHYGRNQFAGGTSHINCIETF